MPKFDSSMYEQTPISGTFHVVVVAAEDTYNTQDGNPEWRITFLVLDGEHAGRKVTRHFYVEQIEGVRRSFVHVRQLHSLIVSLFGGNRVCETNDLIGKVCRCEFSVAPDSFGNPRYQNIEKFYPALQTFDLSQLGLSTEADEAPF